jgi:8-hydroxy-5-deazaflavin:NADPH oxidoreductase
MTGAMPTLALPTLALIGGTGPLGSGLAGRFARAGYPIIIGSRSPDRAKAAAATLPSPASHPARGDGNAAAAREGDIVILTVPWSSHVAILEEVAPHVAGKIVIDTTVPLVPAHPARVDLPPEGSAALSAQRRLPAARVITAFHNVAAHKLHKLDAIDCDVLVFGDARKDREVVLGLIAAIGLKGVHAGPLANSAAGEALTSVLIGINRTYKADGAGIRITGIA